LTSPNTLYVEVIEEYKDDGRMFPSSKWKVEFDLFIPEHRFAVEYDGIYHYKDVISLQGNITQRNRDPEKVAAALKEGITILSVPYWWDGSASQLANSIHAVRADLIREPTGDGKAIPDEPVGLRG
jgi:hypothetical protein